LVYLFFTTLQLLAKCLCSKNKSKGGTLWPAAQRARAGRLRAKSKG
jgi:hypothetical protein